jgi:hypothetical protein
MDIKVFRAPTGQDQRYPKVEPVKDQKQQQKKKDDEQKKKKDQKMDSIFSSLAENLSYGDSDDDGY